MFAGNSLLMRGLLPANSSLSTGIHRPLIFDNANSPPIATTMVDPLTQLLLGQNTMSTPSTTSNLSQLLGLISQPSALSQQTDMLTNLLQLQMLCQQPYLIDLLGKLPGAKIVDVREVPDEKQEISSSIPTLKCERNDQSPPFAQPISSASSVASRKRSARDSETPSPISGIAIKKSKTLRRLHNSDAETNSPVSGMYIKEASEVSADELLKASELDDSAKYVAIDEIARQKIAEIPNVIGDSICALCKVKFDDVFRLAMHRCPRIVHEEYRCPECVKVFNCPANLASHRRWHRPRNSDNSSGCPYCPQRFETKKALREHKCPFKPNNNSRVPTLSTSSPTSVVDGSEVHSEVSCSLTPSDCPSPQPALISLGLMNGSLDIRADSLFNA
ncbi:C2H2-type domain-containing protein [Aphelenchoides besseyi]|nr:C2H2-type domain-containing protein [Aphelenchoides besseyi]KAI6236725.1 C2H2-type domain-containing protein [Aphelenchoides besseyi]